MAILRNYYGTSPAASPYIYDPYYPVRRQIEMQRRAADQVRGTVQKTSQMGIKTATEAVDSMRPLRQAQNLVPSSAQILDFVGPVRPIASGQMALTQAPSPTKPREPTEDLDPAPAPRRGFSLPVPTAPVDSIVVAEQAGSEAWLRIRVPAATTELGLAALRLKEAGDAVGALQAALLGQGLESIRRAVNKLADELFPPQPGAVVGRDGRQRETHERAFLTRIDLAMQSASGDHSLYRLDLKTTKLFHGRLRELISRVAKGVHADGDYEESRQLYTDCWRVVGACRRFADGS